MQLDAVLYMFTCVDLEPAMYYILSGDAVCSAVCSRMVADGNLF